MIQPHEGRDPVREVVIADALGLDPSRVRCVSAAHMVAVKTEGLREIVAFGADDAEMIAALGERV